MYCRKCGKFIDYDGDVCKECAREAAVFEDNAPTIDTVSNKASTDTEVTIVKDNYIKKGKGLGIAGVIIAAVGDIAVVIAYLIYFMSVLAIANPSLTDAETIEMAKAFLSIAPGLIFTCWAGAVIAIPSIIIGIISIRRFISLKRMGVKSVATLVLGIISLALGVSVLLAGTMFANIIQTDYNDVYTQLYLS